MATPITENASALQHLLELLKHFDTTMLVSREGKAFSARPMTILQHDANGTLWFMKAIDASEARTVEFAPRVHLVCQSTSVYLSITATARVVRDEAKLDSLWKESFKSWLPLGRATPDLALMAVQPLTGEYWDHSGAKSIKLAFEAVKAYVTGKEAPVDDAHATANLVAPEERTPVNQKLPVLS